MRSDVPPTYMGNFMKIIPLVREFNDPKPTHMGGKYPYQQYVMYPCTARAGADNVLTVAQKKGELGA